MTSSCKWPIHHCPAKSKKKLTTFSVIESPTILLYGDNVGHDDEYEIFKLHVLKIEFTLLSDIFFLLFCLIRVCSNQLKK